VQAVTLKRDANELLTLLALFWLPVHRFTLLTEVLVTTIILHVSDALVAPRYRPNRADLFSSATLASPQTVFKSLRRT
jgi:hypothetical protein